MKRILDDENPEWTVEDFKRARPASELLPHLIQKRRGVQKTSPKVSTTIRIDREVIDYFRAGGRGWQTRLNNALKEWVAENKAQS